MERIEKQTVDLIFDTSKNRYTINCNATHMPVEVVEALINKFYKELLENGIYESFEMFMHDLKIAQLISRLGWIVATIITLLSILLGRGIL